MRRRLAVMLLLAIAFAAACGGDGGTSTTRERSTSGVLTPLPASDPDTVLSGGYPVYRDDDTGITAILGTPDLGVGRHRVGFVLSTRDGLVRVPVVAVQSFRLPDGPSGAADGPVQETEARFHEFPFGTRGIYTVPVTFDIAGAWSLRVRTLGADGQFVTTEFAFDVATAPRAPDLGAAAPPSATRTLADVASVDELSTGSEPDPALYQVSVADALERSRPFVLVFASPAFCTNALCGPQVEVVGELAAVYGDRADFIHVDLYQNPDEIQGDLGRAVRTPILEEWGIVTDEWTFIVDADGRIAARFEAFVTRDELEAALLQVLRETS